MTTELPENKAEKELRENREKAMERDVNELFSSMPTLEQVANQITIKNENAELLSALEFQSMANNSRPIDLQKIYCSKTGKPLGVLHDTIYKRYVQMQGLAQAEKNLNYLQNSVCTMIDPSWLHTDGEGLKFLSTHDPIGYYVYATAKALAYHRTGYNKEKGYFIDSLQQNKFMLEKIRLWDMLQTVPLTDIIQVNEMWRNFHATLHTKYAKFEYVSLEYYGHENTIKKLTDILATVIKHAVKSKLMHETQITRSRRFDIASQVKAGMFGASNFQAQNKLKHKTTIDQIAELLDNIGFTDEELDDDTGMDFLDFPELATSYTHGKQREKKINNYSGKLYLHSHKNTTVLNVKTKTVEITQQKQNFLDKLGEIADNGNKVAKPAWVDMLLKK